MREYLSHSVQETQQIARELAGQLHSGDVIAYTGGLGMGKTAFTQGLAQGLGLPLREVQEALARLTGQNLVVARGQSYRLRA